MADSDASKPRSGRRPVVSENEEKYNGNNLPTIGAPVALVHEKREDKNPSETAFRRINKATVGPELQEKESVDLERSKKLAELEKLVNDLKSSAARNTVSTVLTGFDKLVSNKREKEIAERMRMSRPTISIQSIVRTNNTGPPQTKDVDSTQTKEVEENTSFGEEFYHSWVNGTPRDNVPHTKKVKAIRINPSSSEGSRSPSPTGTKPSKVDKKEKRLFVYSDSEDEEVEEVSNHQSDDAPVAKRQKPSSSSQVAVITQHTPNKNLVTLPPIAHLQQSTPNQVVLPPIRNLNTKFQSSPQPQPPTPQNVEHRLQLKSVGPRSSPIAARYSQSSSSQNSYASSQSVQNTPVQFERPRVLPIKSNSRQIADVMRDRYSQTENTNVNGQLS
ncbi:hypothetical protein QA089_001591 [Meyerozyma guilliermondii]